MKVRFIILLCLSIVFTFSSFSSSYASENFSKTELPNKIKLYKLDMMGGLWNNGDNEIIYHWTDKDGTSNSIELIVTFSEEFGNITSVKEKNILSPNELESIQQSIEQKGSLSLNTQALPSAKYKLNGGTTRSQFANDHAFDRHKYDRNALPSCSRSRYYEHVDVKDLRSTTVALYDERLSQLQPDNSWNTIFIKQYTGQVFSMKMSDYGNTYYHRVIKSGSYEETHHPYCY